MLMRILLLLSTKHDVYEGKFQTILIISRRQELQCDLTLSVQLIICFILLGTVSSYSSLDWMKFKHDFNKHYESMVEEQERKAIFLENANRMRDFQRMHPNSTFTLAINHLADRRIHVKLIEIG